MHRVTNSFASRLSSVINYLKLKNKRPARAKSFALPVGELTMSLDPSSSTLTSDGWSQKPQLLPLPGGTVICCTWSRI